MAAMAQGAGVDQDVDLNPRERATLRAVALGGAEITHSKAPDLFLDGLPCCDQSTARRLAGLGLVQPTRAGHPGERVPAEVTDRGQAALTRKPVLL